MGGPQLGEIEAGAAAQGFGVPFAIISGGIGTILIVTLIAARWPILFDITAMNPSRQERRQTRKCENHSLNSFRIDIVEFIASK